MKCTVKKGRKYKAKIEIPFFKRAFASEGLIRDRLLEAGFVDVTVKSEGGGDYVATGTWPGEDTTEVVDYVERLDELK
jgi:hypothetical protein